MRTFGTIVALLLIFFGLVAAGLVFVRIWQDNGLIRLDVNTTGVTTPAATAPISAGVAAANAVIAATATAASGETGAAGSPPPLVVGVESGGMALADQGLVVQGGTAVALAAPADGAPTASAPPATVDPCPPGPAEGFAVDTAVVAVGTLRVYSQADVTAPALRDLSAGQGLWIVAGEDGSTAIKRCEAIWQRVRTADGLVGWVLKDAVDVIPALEERPTVAPTAAPTVTVAPTTSPCVGGCSQPGCVQPCATPCYQPCPTPCYQPCVAQPCGTPCGVYTQ